MKDLKFWEDKMKDGKIAMFGATYIKPIDIKTKEYLIAVKKLRTEDKYNYSDEVLNEWEDYFIDCCKRNLSVYKSLEFLWLEIEDSKICCGNWDEYGICKCNKNG